MALFKSLLIVLLIHLDKIGTDPTIKYSSSCSVALCETGNSSSHPLCYKFQTNTNETLCAPQVVCSSFVLCTNGGTRCSSKNSVCIVNSCCPSPICMPISLKSSCIVNQSTSKSSTSTKSTLPTTEPSTSLLPTSTLSDSMTSNIPITTMSTNDLICAWSTWMNGRCSVTCGTGLYIRQRYCIDQHSSNCTSCAPNSDIYGTRTCYLPNCPFRK